MDQRILAEHSSVRLTELIDGKPQYARVFCLGRCLGTGAHCVAYDAVNEDGIPVRLKQFRPRGMQRGSDLCRLADRRFAEAYRQQVAMMRDESTNAATAPLYGLYRDEEGWLWTSVNATAGSTLDKILAERPLPEILTILRRISEAVKAYHDAGWLLLDLKPSNILVVDSPGLQGINFYDFDSFIQLEDLKRAAEAHSILPLSSTEGYSAPEMLVVPVPLEEIGPAADRYSVGAMLFEALFGRAPDYSDSVGSDYPFSEAASPVREYLTREMTDAVRVFLTQTLALTPDGRFETDDALLAALDQLIALLNGKKTLPLRAKLLLAASVLAVLLTGFLLLRPKDISPLLKLSLSPDPVATEELRAQDTSLVLERLKLLGVRDASCDTETGEITASLRTSAFGSAQHLDASVRLLISRPDALFAYAVFGDRIRWLPVGRDQILSAEAGYGTLPQLDTDARQQAGLSLSENAPCAWLKLRLSDTAVREIAELTEGADRICFGFDLDRYAEQIRFALALPGEEPGCYCLLDGRWADRKVYRALAAILSQDVLSEEYDVSAELAPSADWQSRGAQPDIGFGENQCGIEELSGETATLFYRAVQPELLSDTVYDEVLLSFRDRLEQLGCPYALGNSYYEERELAVCLPAEKLSLTLADKILPATALSFVLTGPDGAADYNGDVSAFRAEAVLTDSGTYVLRLTTDSAYERWALSNAAECLGSEGGTLMLHVGSARYGEDVCSTPFPGSTEDGSIVFDRLPITGRTEITEEDVPLLRLFELMINTDGRLSPSFPADYVLDFRHSFLSEGTAFGLKSGESG